MATRRKKKEEPQTTGQQLRSLIKSARDIMRKDKGLNGDLDRLPLLTWIMFLKFLDDMERMREDEAALSRKSYRSLIEDPYRWRDWGADEGGITGPELLAFISQDEAAAPDGKRRPGLFAFLRGLESPSGRGREEVVANVFRGVANRMESGYLLRDVVNKVNGIHFNSSEEIQTLGHLYESMLREMRDAAGDSGEFYTPRPVVQFMVAVTDPQLGETVLDPACGTGGFLCEAYQHLAGQCRTVKQRDTLQKSSIHGREAKPLPYMLAQMNLLLHGLEHPDIAYGNSLAFNVKQIGDKDRVDVILTNPPFGGEEEAAIKKNFPDNLQTSETALLFLQLIMRMLARPERNKGKPGRAAVVVPNGTLFGDGVCARIKEEILKNYNLHTVVRLPNGVFSPYTLIPTNLLFFDRSGPTDDIWYYEIPLPEGRKNYTKTKPMQVEEFADCIAWWSKRKANDQAWKAPFGEIRQEAEKKAGPHWDAAEAARTETREADRQWRAIEKEIKALNGKSDAGSKTKRAGLKDDARAIKDRRDVADAKAANEQTKGDSIYWPIYNLDLKNPNSAEALEHRAPEELVGEIIEKERRILEIMEEIQAELAGGGRK
jgi:type I restriction enzyme M protein